MNSQEHYGILCIHYADILSLESCTEKLLFVKVSLYLISENNLMSPLLLPLCHTSHKIRKMSVYHDDWSAYAFSIMDTIGRSI